MQFRLFVSVRGQCLVVREHSTSGARWLVNEDKAFWVSNHGGVYMFGLCGHRRHFLKSERVNDQSKSVGGLHSVSRLVIFHVKSKLGVCHLSTSRANILGTGEQT